MGYDMHIVQKNGERLPDGDTDAGYFRLNVWGMGGMRRTLEKLNAFDLLKEEHSPWPKTVGEEHFDAEGEPIDEIGRNYRADTDAVLSEETGSGKPPRYKFCSNDGWRVTPRECASIAAAIEGATDEQLVADSGYDTEEWAREVRDFGVYCRKAATHNGFLVW